MLHHAFSDGRLGNGCCYPGPEIGLADSGDDPELSEFLRHHGKRGTTNSRLVAGVHEVARKDPEPIIAQDPRYKGVQERLVGLMSSWCWSSQADA